MVLVKARATRKPVCMKPAHTACTAPCRPSNFTEPRLDDVVLGVPTAQCEAALPKAFKMSESFWRVSFRTRGAQVVFDVPDRMLKGSERQACKPHKVPRSESGSLLVAGRVGFGVPADHAACGSGPTQEGMCRSTKAHESARVRKTMARVL